MTALPKHTGWTCVNGTEKEQIPPPGPEQSDSEEEWHVYGFPELDMLLFSTESKLYIHDQKQLDLQARAWGEGSGTPGMQETYKRQDCRIRFVHLEL